MAYIYPSPGVTGSEVTLSLENSADTGNDSLTIAGLQDMTINASNDVFTWEQLDSGSKFQIATTATNSVAMNLVVDQTTFFGADSDSADSTDTATNLGIFGFSRLKSKVEFSIFLGKTDAGGAGKTISGEGYITGLAPTTSAGEPVWVTPITITVVGDYTIA
ncbi:hypothetical protein N9991_00265 [bacterium]|nr:hypothetical protein [bacterium]